MIKVWLAKLHSSTFLMNALYLMLSTFIVAASGFVFWVIVAHTYETEAVGLATTLLSVSGLLSLLGLAGFDTTFVRFLPGATRKNDYMNTGFMIVTGISAMLAAIVGLALPIFSPNLAILHDTWVWFGFVVFTVITTLNVLTNAIFLAGKKARYIFIVNAFMSAAKIILPLVIARGDAMTIFILAGCAQLAGLAMSMILIIRRFEYTFSLWIYTDMLRMVRKFSLSVYASSVLNLLPPTLLPLIIVSYLGPKEAAYYYMAFTIAGVLYTVAYASMQSAFAEGSHDEAGMRMHVVKAAKLIAVLLLPAILVTVLASHLILAIFGVEYAREASVLLQLFALGALPVAVYSALGATFKVTKNLRGVVSMNVVYVAVILALSLWLVPTQGIIAVGWAWVVGNLAACGTGTLFFFKHNKSEKKTMIIR